MSSGGLWIFCWCRGAEGRIRRQRLQAADGVFVAGGDGAVEAVPVQHVDLGEWGLEEEVGFLAVGGGHGVAVDHAGAPEDLEDVGAVLFFAHPTHELPWQRDVDFVGIGGECSVGTHVAADDRAAAQVAHGVDWKVVHGSSVDEQLTLVDYRGQYSRDSDRCS